MLGKLKIALSVVLLTGSLPAFSQAAITNVGFGEVPLSSLTPLAGTTHFAPYGISFTNGATFLDDSRFIGAGGDSKGISTSVNDGLMGIVFTVPVSTVTFTGLAVNTDFFASVYDGSGNTLGSVFFPEVIGQGDQYPTHTFSGVGDIKKIEFHDHNLFIGVGSLSFTVVPEPASLSMIGIGAATLLRRARRR